MIPQQLQQEGFRFCLIRKQSKAPFEKDWTNKGYKFSDTKLLNHLSNGGNYGCIGGYGDLIILDKDDEKLKIDLDTFTIETGSGGKHYYFLSDYKTNHVFINELGELRANNYQVVGSGSIHPNGNKYKVLKDIPLKIINTEELKKIIKPYLKEEQETTQTTSEDKDTSGSGLEFRRILAMIREKKTRKAIYKEMKNYRKWNSSGDDYKNTTYNKAYDIYLRKKEKTKLPEMTKEISDILEDKNILEIIDKEFDKRIVKEHEARKTIFMVEEMKNVENLGKATDNIMINAHSGTGKDYITESIFDLIPMEEKEELIRTTPKVLAYTRNKAIDNSATWKKVSLRLEDVNNEVLNDDCFKVMSSAHPNKINKAKFVNKGNVTETEIEGKPSIIMTIANANPKEELLRRYPICNLDEGVNQTKEILKRQAKFAKVGKTIDYNETITNVLRLLKRVKVKISFAEELVKIFYPENVIVRTHFPRFLDYIKSSCALHQYQRKVDDQGFFIAEEQDYNIARMMLIKTTSNILMIPLTQLHKKILKVFEESNLERQSCDDLDNLSGIKKLNIDIEWLRKQLNWLTSKGFLIRDKEKRLNEAGKIIPKPIFIYSYNKMQRLEIPEWKNISSFTPNYKITKNTKNTSNSKVNEQIEVNLQDRNIKQKLLNYPKDKIEVVKIK